MIKIAPDKRPPYIFFGLLLIVTVFYEIYQRNNLQIIEKAGVEVHAIVTDAYYSRGEYADIEYQYNG